MLNDFHRDEQDRFSQTLQNIDDHKSKIRCDISVKFKFKEHSCCIVNYDSTYFENLIYMHMFQVFVATYTVYSTMANH